MLLTSVQGQKFDVIVFQSIEFLEERVCSKGLFRIKTSAELVAPLCGSDKNWFFNFGIGEVSFENVVNYTKRMFKHIGV